jgi:hypothetical protein
MPQPRRGGIHVGRGANPGTRSPPIPEPRQGRQEPACGREPQAPEADPADKPTSRPWAGAQGPEPAAPPIQGLVL